MECIHRVGCLPEGVSVWMPDSLGAVSSADRDALAEVISRAGDLSKRAQGLGAVITDYEKFRTSNQILYIYSKHSGGKVSVLGFLKTGKKNLFVTAQRGGWHEITPVCILDFYVHESCQRGGIGHALFKTFLANENVEPRRLAYDRPSPKLLGFLGKHFNLKHFTPQPNNYVVFHKYFEHTGGGTSGSGGESKRQQESRSDNPWATTSMRPLTPASLKLRHLSSRDKAVMRGHGGQEGRPQGGGHHPTPQVVVPGVNSGAPPPGTGAPSAMYGRRAHGGEYQLTMSPTGPSGDGSQLAEAAQPELGHVERESGPYVPGMYIPGLEDRVVEHRSEMGEGKERKDRVDELQHVIHGRRSGRRTQTGPPSVIEKKTGGSNLNAAIRPPSGRRRPSGNAENLKQTSFPSLQTTSRPSSRDQPANFPSTLLQPPMLAQNIVGRHAMPSPRTYAKVTRMQQATGSGMSDILGHTGGRRGF